MILTKCSIKEIDLDQKVDDLIKAGALNELLLIVPTNRKIRYLKKELITLSPGKSSGKINLETLGTFSEKIFKLNSAEAGKTIRSAGKILNDPASFVLLKQSFQECSLKYFDTNKEVPAGTLNRIKNVISEYKKNGITPAKLRQESVSLQGSEKIKAEDISAIYERFQVKCRELNVFEIGDVYQEVIKLSADSFKKNFRELYPGVKTIVINGFDEFTIPEIEIINSAASMEDSDLFINFDYYNYNPLIFSHLDKCYQNLIDRGFKEILDKSKSELKKFQTIIKGELFKTKHKETYDFRSFIIKISCSSREKEIELIAKEIKNLIVEKGIEPHKICIAFNVISKYSQIIRDLFSAYGLPYNLTDRYNLNTSPPVVSIINFLEILENDYYYKNIFRALSSSYLGNDENNTEWIPANLLLASVNLKIISGLENWISSLTAAINEKDYSDEDRFSRNREIYKHALNIIKDLEGMLSPFNKKMSLKEFGSKFSDLIFSFQFHKKLINSAKPDADENIEKNIKAVTIFVETVCEILNLLKLEYNEDEKFNLSFFINNIRTAIEASRYNIKEKSNYGVQITTLNEIRGLQFDYLFISGLNDGDLPTRFTPEIFFSGSYVKNEKRHQTEERYRFYQALCSWKKALYLTIPLQDERQELVESNFLKDFTNLFQISGKDEKDFLNILYSKEELLAYIGSNDFKKQSILNIEPSIDLARINNSIKVDQERINYPFGDSKYTGMISSGISPDAKKVLAGFKEKEFSISQLETYGKCPYKYFAERVLNLKPVEEPSEEIEALEMGSLLHNILYEFYSSIIKMGIVISNSSAEEFQTAYDLLFKIAEEKINEGNFNSPITFYEKEKILGINGNRKNSILYLFLKAEREQDKNFIPEFLELVFGNLPSYNKREKNIFLKELKAGNIKIRGKIDRIDLNERENIYEVVDYKLSGKKPSGADFAEGISLQLPLYMYAAKELINAQLNKDFEPEIPKIYSLKFKEGEFGKLSINMGRGNISAEEKNGLINELIKNCLQLVEKFVNEISEGKFNLSTLKDREKKVCNYCSFKPVCRIQEVG